MMITRRLTALLLLSTALTAPSLAFGAAEPAPPPAQPAAQEETEISIPGGDVDTIVVVGRRNITQATSQVVSVLSTEQIARTGEGNIAGALSRVTGLSLVGSGYVYVRGLGDRYSLALLNGSPLPSPEPLKRVVPLDLFPSSIVSSSLVQKSYSANFPGEFGGGVINLTTRTVPNEGFLSVGGSIGGDTETTGQLGYTYYGSKQDWSGYDNGNRDIPAALASFFASGDRISSGSVNTAAIASELVNGRNAVVQRIDEVQPNFSFSASAGKPFMLGGSELGVIAAAGYSNRWSTRDGTSQTSLQNDLKDLESDFRRVSTDQRLVANGLLGFALDFGPHTVRWTNVYIHDTIKHTRLGLGNRHGNKVDFQRQDTAWFERQLFNTQLVGEFDLTDKLSLDVRGGYAKSQREAPFELSFEYARTNAAADVYGAYFINRLNNGQSGDASISFSDLEEDLWSGGVDATYRFMPDFSATVGYAYADTNRTSSRRDFQFQAPNTFPRGVDLLRPDLLLQPSIIRNFGVQLVETNEGNPAFAATLKNHAGYAKLNGRLFDTLQYDVGVRYETAKLAVSPIQIFKTPGASLAGTNLDNDYWLPAATLTWEFQQGMQFRVNASKTIARPQFRELIYQFFFDPDTDRSYRGNPLLTDSQLTNAEARYEWYLGGDQRFSVAGFYKRIKNPIEAYVSAGGAGDFTTSFANAPDANLYGVEVELQKNFELANWMSGGFWADRRLVTIANYTYSTSQLKVAKGDRTAVFAAASTLATDYFTDGAPLTGQSDHVANLEIGLDNGARLSQQTLMMNFASQRVRSRGLVNSGQPDIIEYPGVRLDFVWREGIEVRGREIELKFEARNLTGVGYEEYQVSGANRVDSNTYDMGRVVALSATAKF
jgi:TonB-dependent receptor